MKYILLIISKLDKELTYVGNILLHLTKIKQRLNKELGYVIATLEESNPPEHQSTYNYLRNLIHMKIFKGFSASLISDVDYKILQLFILIG